MEMQMEILESKMKLMDHILLLPCASELRAT